MLEARGDSRASTSVSLGLPSNSRILSIWFKVDVPGKTALPMTNSARMQPTLHISTALV